MIPLNKCVKGKVYKIHSRNLAFGVFDGHDGFIGIREKFSSLYLFKEYHHEQGPPFGTVSPELELDVQLPEGVELLESLGTIDQFTKRPVSWVRHGIWKFDDTGEEFSSGTARPVNVPNRALFDFLKTVDTSFAGEIDQ